MRRIQIFRVIAIDVLRLLCREDTKIIVQGWTWTNTNRESVYLSIIFLGKFHIPPGLGRQACELAEKRREVTLVLKTRH